MRSHRCAWARTWRPAAKLLDLWELCGNPGGPLTAVGHRTHQIADEEGTLPGSDVEFVYALLRLQVSDGAHPSSGARPAPTKQAKL